MKFSLKELSLTSVSLTYICVLATVAICALAQNGQHGAEFRQQLTSTPAPPTKPQSPKLSPSNAGSGQLFHLSNQGLMTKIMQSDEKFVSSIAYILNFTEYIEQSAVRFLQNGKPPSPDQTFMPCNRAPRDFPPFTARLETMSLPAPDISCLTQFQGVQTFPDEPTTFTAAGLDRALRDSMQRLYEARLQIADVLLGNWSVPDVGRLFSYNTTSNVCITSEAAGIRVGPHWYHLTSVTNAPLPDNLPLFGRQFISEYMRVDGAGRMAKPLRFKLNKRPPDGDPTPYILQNDTTTSLASNRGSVGPHSYGRIYPNLIPAYEAAFDLSDLSIQQANDALTPSSLSILLLPLTLNLIPLALLAPTGSFSMLMYTLMSDVITVVPLALKGIELIYIGRERHVAAAIRFSTAVNGSLSETAGMELWTTECRARENVVPTGISFLVLAIVFIVIGVYLELAAKAHVDRWSFKRKLLKLEFENPLPSFRPLQSISTGNTGAMGTIPRMTPGRIWQFPYP